MERIDRVELGLQMAELISKRGSCQRLQVGAVITLEGRIIATGYNGPLQSEYTCNANNCELNKSCERAVHAEANAIYFAARNGIALEGGILYCTYSPCTDCAEAIVQSGIKTVIFRKFFRDTLPINRLKSAGVSVQKEDAIVHFQPDASKD